MSDGDAKMTVKISFVFEGNQRHTIPYSVRMRIMVSVTTCNKLCLVESGDLTIRLGVEQVGKKFHGDPLIFAISIVMNTDFDKKRVGRISRDIVGK